MIEPQITVLYERKFSDGNYGSEGLSLAWTGPYGRNDELVIAARYTQIFESLRGQVLEHLSRSEASNVARAAKRELHPPKPADGVPVGDSEGLEDLPF